jgi:hypothetical protein
MLNFKEMFDNYHANQEKSWAHDRSKTLGGSEAFGCLRKAGFEKRGKEFGAKPNDDYEDSWGAIERGNLIENYWVVPALDDELPDGVGYVYAGGDQKTFFDEPLSVTPDGLITDLPKNALKNYGIDDIEGDCVVLEIKSVDPRVNLSEEKSIHRGQAQIQLHLIREQTEFKPMYAVILYIDASFFDDMSVFIIKYDPRVFRSAKIRANRVFGAEDLAELEAEGKVIGGCEHCKWTHACATVSKELIPTGEVKAKDLDGEIRDRIYLLVKKEREKAQEEKWAKEEKEDLRARIKQALVEANTKRVNEDRYSVSWNFQKGRSTLDQSAMIADGIDPDKYKKQGAGFEKMTIKLVGENEDD